MEIFVKRATWMRAKIINCSFSFSWLADGAEIFVNDFEREDDDLDPNIPHIFVAPNIPGILQEDAEFKRLHPPLDKFLGT